MWNPYWKSTSTRAARRRAQARFLTAAILIVLAAIGGFLYGREQSPADLAGEDRETLALFAEALDRVREDYVAQEDVDPEKQTYAAIEGMLDSLGDEGHTRFLTPEEVEESDRSYSGTYTGVGIDLERGNEELTVDSVTRESPAQEAGIRSGDVLVAVDGESVEGADASEVVRMVRGPEGTTVKLTVRRDGTERDFTMKRAELENPSVSWRLLPGTKVAHMRLDLFSSRSAEEVSTAIDAALEAGAERIILDLRGNPGGQVDQAVRIAGEFLDPETVVYLREDGSGERDEVRVDGGAEPTQVPLVVLVDGGSASSSEIVAGALRDNDRATVVGTTTYGTGTVLKQYSLRDGSAILLGVAEWLTPNGDFIRESGIEPDVEVKLGEDDELVLPDDGDLSKEEALDRDPQLRRAFEIVNEE